MVPWFGAYMLGLGACASIIITQATIRRLLKSVRRLEARMARLSWAAEEDANEVGALAQTVAEHLRAHYREKPGSWPPPTGLGVRPWFTPATPGSRQPPLEKEADDGHSDE